MNIGDCFFLVEDLQCIIICFIFDFFVYNYQMIKVDFIKNNRGIDDGKDFLEEYFGVFYD